MEMTPEKTDFEVKNEIIDFENDSFEKVIRVVNEWIKKNQSSFGPVEWKYQLLGS